MTLTKDQLNLLLQMLAKCSYEDAAPIMQFLQNLLHEQKPEKLSTVKNTAE